MTSENVILKVENLNKIYADQNEKTEILNQVSIEIKKKEFVCILGPSGCGKTTLLRCIAGFESFDGKIIVDNVETSVPDKDRIMVFQDFNQLFPWKTVEKNIQYPLKIQGIKDKNELQRISDEVLKKVKLEEYKTFYPHHLSGGMKQRVAIAKALALQPKIILMDEPFAALDAMTRSRLQQELLKISQETDITFIFVTHNIQEAIILGTRVMVFGQKGKILVDDKNSIKKPVSPASEGYGTFWQKLHDALYQE